MYKLTFDEQSKGLFDAAYQALAFGDPPQPTEWDDYLSLMFKFKRLGQPGEKAGKTVLYAYSQPCCLELERSEARILRDRIERPIWIPEALERAVALRNMLRDLADENGVRL